MKKVLPILGAGLSVLAVTWGSPSQAQDAKTFQDVPQSHWAYEAVADLQSKGIIIGYPDGYFRGKRALTRYEFAVALKRALDKIPAGGGPGQVGATGPQGEPGPAGPPGVTPEELAQFRRLAEEFRNELNQLGANVKDIQNRLDALSKDVADLKDVISRQIKFSADVFAGFRSDRSRYAFQDYSGATRGASNSNFDNVSALHDVHLNAIGNLPNGIRAKIDLTSNNYYGYRQNFGIDLGGPSAANQAGSNGTQFGQTTTLYEANLAIPIGGFGSNTVLTIGRFKNSISPLTYYRPDTDAYFDLPWYDDGAFVADGFKLEAKFGSAKTLLFANSYSSATDNNGNLINSPIVGANFGFRQFSSYKPFGLVTDRAQITPGQSAGLHIGIPVARVAEVGATIIDFGNINGAINTLNAPAGTSLGAFNGSLGTAPGQTPFGNPYNNVLLYGANVKLNAIGRFTLSGEAAKTVTQRGIDTSDTNGPGSGNSNEDNNAYILNVGYNLGPVNLVGGYQYIDPRFAAPGYWNKIGNWYNPTNIQGAFGRATFNVTRTVTGYVGGDYYTGARNRPGFNYGTGGNGFTRGSTIYRGTAGVKVNLGKYLNVGGDYEGVFYDLSPAASFSGGRAKPIEQYITIHAGLNLASNAVLKLAYQIINQQDVGTGFGGVGQGFHTSNAGVFTTQVAVHF